MISVFETDVTYGRVKEGIFVCPQIRFFINDVRFKYLLVRPEKAFKSIVENFL